MFKKLLAILLACLLMIPCGLALAEDAEALTSGDFEYTLNTDGSATITEYSGEAESLTIPAELDGHPVTAIGDIAFFRCEALTSITIPDSVTSIGANPFAYCEQLTQISVSANHPTLATIDGVLFDKTTRTLLCYPCAFTEESYAVPEGIQAIGGEAFSGCEALRSITLPRHPHLHWQFCAFQLHSPDRPRHPGQRRLHRRSCVFLLRLPELHHPPQRPHLHWQFCVFPL